MRSKLTSLLPALLLLFSLVSLGGCGCGFDCNSSNSDTDEPAFLTLGLSDSLPEDLKEVVIKVDSITLRRTGTEKILITNFTVPAQGLVDAPSFQVDLLKYRGVEQLKVIQDLKLTAGTYSEVSIGIIADDPESSYVLDANDKRKPITVADGTLTLPGVKLLSGNQAFTIEFGLAQALQFQPTSDRYLLATDGIRIENNQTGATLSGTVDSTLFDGELPCREKNPPTAGNRIYLYKGGDLTSNRLADVFTTASVTARPTNALAPFAVASLVENSDTRDWEYAFGYLPAGDYTLAFACDTVDDQAVEYNGLVIPLPENQVYEIELSKGEESICNLTPGASC